MKMPSQRLSAFITLSGSAEEAMRFYEKNLPGMKIDTLVLFDKDASNGDEGKVFNGILSYYGQQILFLDMQAANPAPPPSWSISLFIACEDEAEFDALFAPLSQDGVVMMGPEPVMDMRKCTWVTDKFGITWQLVWA